jgi:hypothetical protein
LILEWAVACLITDRAVKRMVDKQELETILLGASNLLVVAMRVHDHSVRHPERATGLQLREVVDDRITVLIYHDFACRSVLGGRARLNETLTAIRRHRERRVIAEVRHLDPKVQAELQQPLAFLKLV